MKAIGKKLLLIGFMVLFLISFGCAFGTRHVTLNPMKTSLNLDASGQKASLEVTDKRDPSLKPVVGHVKNTYGMKTAKVVADKEVSTWVRDVVAGELKRIGGSIETDGARLDNKAGKIRIDVLVFYAQAYTRYGAEVKVALSVNKNDRDIIKEKIFVGKATLGMSLSASSASYQKVLELAMEDMLKKLIPEVLVALGNREAPPSQIKSPPPKVDIPPKTKQSLSEKPQTIKPTTSPTGVAARQATGGAVGTYQEIERQKDVLRAKEEAQKRTLEQQRAAVEEKIRVAREQLEQQRRMEDERLQKEREEADKQLELEMKKLELQMQLERDKLAEQKRQFDTARQPDTGQEKPAYSKANKPNLNSGDSVSDSLTVQKKEAVADKSLDDGTEAIAEEIKKLQQELKRSEELLAKMSRVLEAKLAEEKVSKEAAVKKPLEQEMKSPKPEVDKVPPTTQELPTERTGQKQVAYVPGMSKNVFDELRSGKGPFKIDDFEDKDLHSIYFNDWWRDHAQGQASLKLSSDPTQGANGTSSSMKIEYSLNQPKASVSVNIGGWRPVRAREVERNKSTAYDLSRFDKMVFYLKGSKEKGLLSRANQILVLMSFYGEELKSERGKGAYYQNKMVIRPEQKWQRVEIPLKDLEPSAWTRYNVSKYPPKPDLRNVLGIEFVFSSFESDGGYPGSDTVWIDEIMLQ